MNTPDTHPQVCVEDKASSMNSSNNFFVVLLHLFTKQLGAQKLNAMSCKQDFLASPKKKIWTILGAFNWLM